MNSAQHREPRRGFRRPSSQGGEGDAVYLLGLINQSSGFEIAISQALSIKNESCCTCQRHSEGIDVRFIFLLAAADWGASNSNRFN